MIRALLVSSTLLALAGCASVIDGATQEVTIETPGTGGALCFLERPGYRVRVWTPKTLRVMKSEDPLKVTCHAPGNRERTLIVEPKVNDTVSLNVLNGFVPGALYDYDTGAMFTLPEKIIIDFTYMEPVPSELPDYQKVFRQNPELKGMEEFRPGLPAMQRDAYDRATPLQPRVTAEQVLYGVPAPVAVTAPGAPVPVSPPPLEGAVPPAAQSSTSQPVLAPSGFTGGKPVIGSGTASEGEAPAATGAPAVIAPQEQP